MSWKRPVLALTTLAAVSAGALGGLLDADMRFGAPVKVTAGQDPVGVVAGDFDGDGDVDLAFVDAATGTVKVRRNDGSGTTFTTNGVTLPTGTATAIVGDDLDGDLDLDLVVASTAGIYVVRNDGLASGVLQFQVSGPTVPYVGAVARDLALADYDGNSALDLVLSGSYSDAGNPSGGFVAVQLNDGTGLFGTATAHIFDEEVADVAAGDLTLDGRPEVVVGFEQTSRLVTIENPGDGTVDLGVLRQSEVAGHTHVRHVMVYDYSQDTVPDLVIAGWETPSIGDNDSAVLFLRNGGPGNGYTIDLYLIANTATGTPASGHAIECGFGEFDGDPAPELVVTSPFEGKVKILKFQNQLQGPPLLGVFQSFDCAGDPRGLAVADLNGDLRQDVVTWNGSGNEAQALLNQQGGGGGGGDGIHPALGLTVKSKSFGGAFQSGQKFTFACQQPGTKALPLSVRVQSTETPEVEGSWTDLPVDFVMAPGKKAGQFKLKTTHVPPGERYFRTVTTSPGLPDGISYEPRTEVDGPGYIGPVIVLPGGTMLEVTGHAAPASDPLEARGTFPGEEVLLVVRVENTGGADAKDVVVQIRQPADTTLVSASPEGYEVLNPTSAKPRYEWVVPTLEAGEDAFFTVLVRVSPTATRDFVFDSFDAEDASNSPSTRIPSSAIRLPLGSPLRLDVRDVTGIQPHVGGFAVFHYAGRNAGTTTLPNAVLTSFLPRGTYLIGTAFTDANGDPLDPPATAPGGRQNPHYDRAKRQLFWYFGDLEGGEEVHARLILGVQYDAAPGAELRNGQFQLRAGNAAKPGDPLQFDALPESSGNPFDVVATLDSTPPATRPELRVDQWVEVEGRRPVYDPRFGDVPPVAPGGRVDNFVLVANTGTADAIEVHLKGNLAHLTTLDPVGPFVVDLANPSVAMPASYTVSSGGTLDIDLGYVAAGQRLFVLYQSIVDQGAKSPQILSATGFHARSDSFDRPVFAGPRETHVLVAKPFVPRVDLIADREHLQVGDVLTYYALLSNEGDVAGRNAVLTIPVPDGTVLYDDPAVQDDIALYDEQGDLIGSAPVNKKSNKVQFKMATVPVGAGVRGARIAVQVVAVPKSGSVSTTATFTGTSVAKAGGGSTDRYDFTDVTPIVGNGQTHLGLAAFMPVAHVRGTEFEVCLVAANAGNEPATNVVLQAIAPTGTTVHIIPGLTDDGKAKGQKVTWKIGTIAPHSAEVRRFRILVDPEENRDFALLNQVALTADNAAPRTCPAVPTALLTALHGWESFRWPSVSTLLQANGMALGGKDQVDLVNAISGVKPQAFLGASGGIDLINVPATGVYLMPLGSGRTVVAGLTASLNGPSFETVTGFDFTRIGTGGGDVFTTSVPGFGTLTANQVQDRAKELVDAGAINVIPCGAGTMIGADGTSLLSSAGVVLDQVQPILSANLLPLGGANLVAAGAGNLVAAGAGNLVAAGAGNLIGLDSASLIGVDGATLVAAGAGNLVAAGAGNMVAAGAGNLVAAGAGNLVAAGGLNLVAAGAGNLIGPDGASKRPWSDVSAADGATDGSSNSGTDSDSDSTASRSKAARAAARRRAAAAAEEDRKTLVVEAP